MASPSKATAYVGWAPDPWSLRVQSQQTFDLSDADGNKISGYNTVDFIASYALPVGKLSFSLENLLVNGLESVLIAGPHVYRCTHIHTRPALNTALKDRATLFVLSICHRVFICWLD